MKTVITLGDMQAKGMHMLEVACRKCERRGRLSIARLIAEHGRDDHGELCVRIAHNCPRMQNPAVSIYEGGFTRASARATISGHIPKPIRHAPSQE